MNVDLKWGLWSQDEGTWEERAPGALALMKLAFDGETGPVTINTAPRKEIRHGHVIISKGKARGRFSCEWDDVADLADTLGAVPYDDSEEPADNSAEIQAFADMLPFTEHGDVGVSHDFEVEASTFEELMTAIDAEEDAVVTESNEVWADLERMYRGRRKTIDLPSGIWLTVEVVDHDDGKLGYLSRHEPGQHHEVTVREEHLDNLEKLLDGTAPEDAFYDWAVDTYPELEKIEP